MLKDKRGDMFQLLFLLIILFISSIVGLLFLGMTLNVFDIYKETGLLNETIIGQKSMETLEGNAPYTTDYMIFFLFIGGIIGVCVSAIRTDFSPTLVMLFIFVLIITIFVASGFVNIYSGFAGTSALEEASGKMGITGFIFSRFTPLIFAILGGIIMIIMWSKSVGDIST